MALPHCGAVQLVASRVPRQSKVLPLICSGLSWSAERILRAHRTRWSIESYFKETKQYLGLGDYQNLSYQSAVRHLHLVCIAYVLLTHMGSAPCAQGKPSQPRLCVSPRVTELQTHLRRVVLQDMADLIKRKAAKRHTLNDLLEFLAMDAAD